ncbi:unnamed protein product [Pedinophyceae sp. YPF-701]|nr:unnamed protein product [Pedinophyceae sp. YPF-701]
MSTVDKLLIKGIRAFGSDRDAVIVFSKPLTLIVGHNGAGKTTIIECLKQATTGDMPPNTRNGGGFVHDPKVAGTSETKGQIKLKITTARGIPLIINRNFQVKLQKKSGQTFKSLDATVQTRNQRTGEAESLSYKNADMDRMVPNMMGVSKAILENVVFVHQEDSNWPLGEPAALKKRFDEIFAATKYSKAIEQLGRVKKEQAQAAKEGKLKLATLESHQAQAARLREDVRSNEDNARRLEEQMGAQRAAVEELERALEGAQRVLARLAEIERGDASERAQREMLQRAMEDASARIGGEVPSDTLEDLEAFLRDDLDARIPALRADLARHEKRADQLSIALESTKARRLEEMRRQGTLLAKRDRATQDAAERDAALRDACAEYGVDLAGAGVPAAGPLDDAAYAAGVAALDAHKRALEAALGEMQAESRAADAAFAKDVDGVVTEATRVRETARAGAERRAACEKRASEARARALALAASEEEVATLEAAAADAQGALARARGRPRRPPRCSDHDAVTARLDAAKRRVAQLWGERAQLAERGEVATRLRVKAQDLASRRAQVETLLHGAVEGRGGVTGAQLAAEALRLGAGDAVPDAARLPALLEAAARDRVEEERGAERVGRLEAERASGARAALGAAERKEAELGEREKRLQEAIDQVLSGPGASDAVALSTTASGAPPTQPGVDAQLSELRHEHGEAAQEHGMLETVKKLCGAYLREAQKRNRCKVCKRGFANEAEREAFCAEQQATMEESSDETRERVAQLQARIDALESIKGPWERLRELRATLIPDARAGTTAARAALADAEERATAADDALAAASLDAQAARDAVRLVGEPLARLQAEISTLGGEVKALESDAAAQRGARTLADVVREIEDAEGEQKTLETQREVLLGRISRGKDQILLATEEARSAGDRARDARARLEERRKLEALAKEAAEAAEAAAREAAGAKSALAPLEARAEELRRARAAAGAEARSREDAASASIWEVQAAMDGAARAAEAAASFVRDGHAEQLQRTDTLLATLAQEAAAHEEQAKLERAEVRSIEHELSRAAEDRGLIEGSLAYRRAERQLQQLDAASADRASERASLGDPDGIRSRLRHTKTELDEALERLNMMRGSHQTVIGQAARSAEDLRHPNYDGIDQRYRDQKIEVRTSEMAAADLENYGKALERALQSFHAEQMEAINRTVRELWQRTYRNSDIDFIEIRSDSEGATARSKSYNYRVVMHTGGTELDMRGRCSAGQKVLACLIIRLALAETFCLKCGILALDEPTTNLDRENSRSLAEALRGIIDARRGQRNFQLIVITHDEEFATWIGTREFADHLWRVEKDERACSRLTKESI